MILEYFPLLIQGLLDQPVNQQFDREMADLANNAAIGLTVKAEEDIFSDVDAKTLRAKQHSTVLFRINVNTKLKKLKRAFSTKVGVTPDALVFTFGGMTIVDTHAPSDLFMIDQDVILVKHEAAFLSRVAKVPSTRVTDFGNLLNRPEYADVVLLVGKEKVRIPAIKAILCARSEKFRGMFSDNFAEGRQQEVALSDHQPQLMRALLRYLYTDEIEMPEEAEEAAALLMLADEYMLPSLKRECEVALLTRVRERNVSYLLNKSDMYGANVLKEVCKQYVLDNFDTKPSLGEELAKFPHLLVEITTAAIVGNKKRRLN